ncbi:GAF domain-containing protein [Sabulicella rubraurantiaca]|uniref:GAF domain-containing protein n=1 Tax=Sabulicella rubraurantiaca TaxID=2811429 RepID=UPI001A96EDD1|nr:GAF domain-containing protein [Sabulicella rubraurantiaca]
MNDPILDPERLAALRETGLLDTSPEETFDQLSRLASILADAPVAVVSLVDQDRQFFKSFNGTLPGAAADVRETPLSHSICRHVVETGRELVVEDTRNDPLTQNNPAVTENSVAAYAGFPLVTPTGHVLGTLCVLDSHPRAWSETARRGLAELAAVASRTIEYRTLALPKLQAPNGGPLVERRKGSDRRKSALPNLAQSVEAYLACLDDYRSTTERADDPDLFAKEAQLRQRVLSAEGDLASAAERHLREGTPEASSGLATACQEFLSAKLQQAELMARFQKGEAPLDQVERVGALTIQLEQALRAAARDQRLRSA